MSTSSAARGRSAKGQRLTSTMANGETSRNTTTKLNKNQQNSVQENQNATSNHHQSSPASSNRGNTNNGSTTTPTPDQKSSVNAGPGGRLRRRSAPPVTLESKNMLQKFTDFPWNRFTLIDLFVKTLIWRNFVDAICNDFLVSRIFLLFVQNQLEDYSLFHLWKRLVQHLFQQILYDHTERAKKIEWKSVRKWLRNRPFSFLWF